MLSEQAAMHDALESVWERLFAALDGARHERRSDLVVWVFPPVAIPQVNGPWVVEDSADAVAALPAAVAEVEAAGGWTWVQTRSAHERTRRTAVELGLTHLERVPGMVVRPGELVDVDVALEVEHVLPDDAPAVNALLAQSFGAPAAVFEVFAAALASIDEAAWYIGRAGGTIVSTAVAFTLGGATGIFNVATAPRARGQGYGAAITARAVRDGFDAGAEFAYLQSSELGHGVYRSLGFRDVEEYVLLARPSPSTGG